MESKSKVVDHNFNIEVNISEILLTPFACSSIVNEILKGLLYQKCQIPYPYNWIKSVVTKKRQKSETETNARTNFKAESHFRQVSTAFDTLEEVLSNITTEFLNSGKNIKEIIVVLGTTPFTATEVFTISLSSLVKGHNEKNHVTQLNKYQPRILRSIFLSQDWIDKINATMACTNTYLYLVRNGNDLNEDAINGSSSFIPTAPLHFSNKTKHVKISLSSKTPPDTNCCENLRVFGDDSDNLNAVGKNCNENKYEDEISWFKYKDFIKGFKDCFINKKSAIELW